MELKFEITVKVADTISEEDVKFIKEWLFGRTVSSYKDLVIVVPDVKM